jgi:hypothetical protein
MRTAVVEVAAWRKMWNPWHGRTSYVPGVHPIFQQINEDESALLNSQYNDGERNKIEKTCRELKITNYGGYFG